MAINDNVCRYIYSDAMLISNLYTNTLDTV